MFLTPIVVLLLHSSQTTINLLKLNGFNCQVLEDISELRKKWVQARVDRVSNNTYKLYQVRKNLKQSKVCNYIVHILP